MSMGDYVLRIQYDPVGQGLGVVETIVNWEEFDSFKAAEKRKKELSGPGMEICIYASL